MELQNLSDDELALHLGKVLNEQERRRRLAGLPQQMADMADRYVADGGERTTLVDAISTSQVQEDNHG